MHLCRNFNYIITIHGFSPFLDDKVDEDYLSIQKIVETIKLKIFLGNLTLNSSKIILIDYLFNISLVILYLKAYWRGKYVNQNGTKRNVGCIFRTN
jgi:hypothetical protein